MPQTGPKRPHIPQENPHFGNEGADFPTQPSISDSPIPQIYGAIDTDLGRDNLEIDFPKADIQDL